MPYILGVIIALGLFGGVLIHELAHSILAKSKGIKINSITLLIFGGISSMEEETPDPKVELPMAAIGPLTSLVVGIVCIAIMYLAAGAAAANPAVAGVFVFMFGYLGLLNVFLFGFNLLPAFPMDGGRVLRAFLARSMPLNKATRIAADVGKVFAVLFGILGIFLLNPILILIAFFIYIGASQESTAMKYNFLLKDVMVSDIMATDVRTVSPELPVREVIDLMYTTKHLGFPVEEKGQVTGMVTLADVHKIAPLDREAMQVRDIMTRGIIALPPKAPVIDALRIMSGNNIGRIPVMEGDQLLGIVTRTDIMKVIELKEM
jgi:Zn-dependent protease/CBS domain-containing protein